MGGRSRAIKTPLSDFTEAFGAYRDRRRGKTKTVTNANRIADSIQALSLPQASLQTVLSHVFADIDEAVVVSDEHRRVILVNRGALELFGFDEAELIGRSAGDIYADPAVFAEEERTRFHVDASRQHTSYLCQYRRRDGSVFDAETIAGPMRDPASGRVMHLNIIRDVTARLSAEKALHSLHTIASDQTLDFAQRRRAILELGCAHFGLPTGVIGRIEDNAYEVVDVIDTQANIQVGDVFPVADTFCWHVLAKGRPFGVDGTNRERMRAQLSDRRFGTRTYVGSPILVAGELYGTLNFSGPEDAGLFSQADMDLVGMFAQWVGQEIRMERSMTALTEAHEQLSRVATIDELTGLGNRRLLMTQLDHEIERGRRYDAPLSVALLDLDHFKQLNDMHGHAVGDAALRHFAQLAEDSLRGSDLIGRWGGEEFLLLLPDTCAADAVTTLNRLLTKIRDTPVSHEDEAIRLSASAGVAESDCQESAEAIIHRADSALYRAKAAGRDRVEQS
nr:diguanylate cyclase [Endozoicomonas sp. G2_2]